MNSIVVTVVVCNEQSTTSYRQVFEVQEYLWLVTRGGERFRGRDDFRTIQLNCEERKR